MKSALLLVLACLVMTVSYLAAWRALDRHNDRETWQRLAGWDDRAPEIFDPAAIAALPDPARRYFLYTIAPGTPLRRTARILMEGEIGMGTRDVPNYRPMRADQILATPEGLVWRLRAGPIAGSDGLTGDASWTRFWLAGLVPVVRVGGDTDHHRSAFGRVVAEGTFWTPAALLPGPGVHWEEVSADTVRVTLRHGHLEQSVEITVAADGQPTRVVMLRWSNANSDGVWQNQPFGGELSEFRNFDGYRLPTRVDGGNFIGTEAYFPFYRARVTEISFDRLTLP